MPRIGGAPPSPTALKLVKGMPKARINQDEPIPEDGIPECPSPQEKVREVWDYTCRQLKRMRTITMADRDALLPFCEAVVMHREAAKIIADEGMIVKVGLRGELGMAAHPAVRIHRETGQIIRQFGHDFGLNPAARSRIKVGDQTPKEDQMGPQRLLSS